MNSYATDDLVMELQNKKNWNKKICKAHYVLSESEAMEQHGGFFVTANNIMMHLKILYQIEICPSFVFANSPSPLQVIFLGGDRFVIAISTATFYHLITLCLRLQRYNPISKFLGFNSIEQKKDYTGKTIIDITRDIIRHPQSLDEIGTASYNVFHAAFFYLIAHEYAHIAHGHLEFISSENFSNFSTDSTDKNLTFKCMEMDADASATSLLFDYYQNVISPKIFDRPEINLNAYQLNMLIFRRYVFGIYCCILLSDSITDNYFPEDHPITYVRYIGITSVLEIIFKKRDMEFLYGLTETMRENIVNVFISLSGELQNLHHPLAANLTIFGDNLDTPETIYCDMGVNFALQQLEPLHCRWAKIRPFLETYLRGGVLAPAARSPA